MAMAPVRNPLIGTAADVEMDRRMSTLRRDALDASTKNARIATQHSTELNDVVIQSSQSQGHWILFESQTLFTLVWNVTMFR